jgi:hypothetical protein
MRGTLLIGTVLVVLVFFSAVSPSYVLGQVDLTGVWKETGGEGRYYLRQIGTDLYWAGLSPDEGKTWTNVFSGKITGDTIFGNWADVPRGVIQNTGILVIKITDDGNKLSITERTGGFGTQTLERTMGAVPPPPPPPPPPPAPVNFILRINSITVDEARSPFTDTVYVSLAGKVDDRAPLSQTRFLGDLGDGSNPTVNLDVGPFDVPADQTLAFSFLVENKGGGGISQTLIDMGKGAVGMLGSGAGIGVAAAEGIIRLVAPGLLPGGCNGLVAAAEIVFSKSQLEEMTSGGPHTETTFFPGSDSGIGCGTNSRYHVTWSIIRAQ